MPKLDKEQQNLLKTLGKKAKKKWNEARTQEPQSRSFTNPPNINNGEAELSGVKLNETDNCVFLQVSAKVLIPEDHKGRTVSKTYFFSKNKEESFETNIEDLCNDLQRFEVEVDDIDLADGVGHLNDLCNDGIVVVFNTGKEGQDNNGNTRVNLWWVGLAEDDDPSDEEEPEEEDEDQEEDDNSEDTEEDDDDVEEDDDELIPDIGEIYCVKLPKLRGKKEVRIEEVNEEDDICVVSYKDKTYEVSIDDLEQIED